MIMKDSNVLDILKYDQGFDYPEVWDLKIGYAKLLFKFNYPPWYLISTFRKQFAILYLNILLGLFIINVVTFIGTCTI